MALVPQSIPALYGGVSQQAAVVRNPTQAEDALNCDFSVVKGCSKRPGLECLSELVTADLRDSFVHWHRMANGRWFVLVCPGDGTYSVFDTADGQKITSTADSSQPYLTTTGPARQTLYAVSVENEVYIANREVDVILDEAVTAGTLAGSAQTLQDDVLGSAAEGSIYEILGDENNPNDGYYAKKSGGKWFEWVQPGIPYQLDQDTMPWVFDFQDDAVDPLGVTVDFMTVAWGERQVGDPDSNKAPSFVGKPIHSLSFKSDRLVVFAGQNFVASQVGEYRDFWRSTVTDVLDDDRIDEKVNAFEVSDVYFGETVSKSLVLFANEKQFSVDGEVFAPGYLKTNPITGYPTSPYLRPISIGPTCYFAADAGDYTQLREMFIQEDTVTMDAADVTAHVPDYVPSGVHILEGHPSLDHILMGSPGDPSALFSYQFYWKGDQKALSAWNRWEFAAGIEPISIRAIGPYFYVLYHYTSNTDDHAFLGRINIKRGDNTPGFTHRVHLDHMQKVEPVFNDVENRTYFTTVFPIMDQPGEFHDPVLMRGAGWGNQGSYLRRFDGSTSMFASTPNSFWMVGDWTGTGEEEWWIGLPYTQSYTFSEQFYYRNDRPQLHTRVNLRTVTVHFEDTGYFRVDVKVRGHDEVESDFVPGLSTTFTARTVGDEYFRLNQPQLSTGTYQFPILARASDARFSLVNDTPLPAHFQSAEWKGLISTRTPR